MYTVLDHTQTGLRPILQIPGRLMKLRSTELQIMSWYMKQTTSITSGALVHHLMRPGTGVCIFGLVGDVHSEARCASAPEAAAWLWRNDMMHSSGSFVSQAQTSSSSGRVKHGLLPPDLTSPTPVLQEQDKSSPSTLFILRDARFCAKKLKILCK